MTLGNRIKQARKARGLSLAKLGEKMGMSRQLVWQWERDESDPRKHIEELAKHLDVPVDYFYGSKRPAALLEAKIKRLTPDQQALIETMIDTLLRQQEQPPAVDVKLA